MNNYQTRVNEWMQQCFGDVIARSIKERNFRFMEESLELVQSLGVSKSDVLALVDYVFSRPEGEPTQEVGGVMVTLAALCNAAKIDLDGSAEKELARVWSKIDKIRAKHNDKLLRIPESALPGNSTVNNE